MTETLSLDDLIAALDKQVESGLAQLRELEANGGIKMGAYGPRETLCQIVWWCATCADGMGISRRGRRAGPHLRPGR